MIFASTIKRDLDALIRPFLPGDRIQSWQFFSLSTRTTCHFLQAFMVSAEKSTVVQIFPRIRKMFFSHFQDFFFVFSFRDLTMSVLALDLFVSIPSETPSRFFNLYVCQLCFQPFCRVLLEPYLLFPSSKTLMGFLFWSHRFWGSILTNTPHPSPKLLSLRWDWVTCVVLTANTQNPSSVHSSLLLNPYTDSLPSWYFCVLKFYLVFLYIFYFFVEMFDLFI